MVGKKGLGEYIAETEQQEGYTVEYEKSPYYFIVAGEYTVFQGVHCKHTVAKIWNKHSQKWSCAASFPIPTFMYLWAIYLF